MMPHTARYRAGRMDCKSKEQKHCLHPLNLPYAFKSIEKLVQRKKADHTNLFTIRLVIGISVFGNYRDSIHEDIVRGTKEMPISKL